MNTTHTIQLPKREHRRLDSIAFQYGFNADEFARRIIAEATHSLLKIEVESWDEYDNPEGLKKAYKQAVHDDRQGKLLTELPLSIRRLRK